MSCVCLLLYGYSGRRCCLFVVRGLALLLAVAAAAVCACVLSDDLLSVACVVVLYVCLVCLVCLAVV